MFRLSSPMAQKFNLLCALWIVGFLFAPAAIAAETKTTIAPTTTTTAPTTTTPSPTTTTPSPTTTTTAPTTTTTAPTTTTPSPTTTTPSPTTTTTAPTTTTPSPTTTTTAPTGTTTAPTGTTTAPTGTTTAPTGTTTAPTGTTTAPTGTTTAPTGTTTAPTGTPSTTLPPDPCANQPCKDGSICEKRLHESYVCLCPSGDLYNNETDTCDRQKAFLGTLNLPGTFFGTGFEDPESPEFDILAEVVIQDMKTILKDLGDATIIVRKFEEEPTKAVKVKAILDILFPKTADVTTGAVTEALGNECKTCILIRNPEFVATPLCDAKACCDLTSTCNETDGSFECKCKEGYKFFSDRLCINACPDGKEWTGESCVECPFGYTGLNCEDSWKLNSVIIGSVLGGLLLLAVVLVAVFATNSPKKSSKMSKKAGSEKPYESHPSAKAPLSNSGFANGQPPAAGNRAAHFGNGGVPRIPRATTTSSWDDGSNLEMTPSNSRQNLIQGRNTASSYAPTQPQNNPYTQNRPQVNPYAVNQGRTNPYFMEDNGRRFN